MPDTPRASRCARMRHRTPTNGGTRASCLPLRNPTRPAGDTACAATCSGVIADLAPDENLAALQTAARAGTRAALGDEACRYQWGLQHLTTAYAHAEADSDAAQRILRRVRPSHAPLHVDRVHLVDVTAQTDTASKTVTWKRLATIALEEPN